MTETDLTLEQIRLAVDEVIRALGQHGVVLVCEYTHLVWRLSPAWPTPPKKTG